MEKRNLGAKSKVKGGVHDVIFPDFPDDDTTVTKSRRVSFGTNFIKEFIVGSAATSQCVLEYEQAFSSSDSSNPNSSISGLGNGLLQQSSFAAPEENHKANLPPPEPEDARSVKRPKISSTICFSADSPTADMEFTEGCISLAKSILDKKNKEMTVFIKAKPKDVVEGFKSGKEEETKYFEGSQIDMSMTKCFKTKEIRKEEKKFEGDKTVVFGKSGDDMTFTRCGNFFQKRHSKSLLDDTFSDSWENENQEEKQVPLDLIMHHLDKDNSDLEDSLFHPQVSLTDALKSNLNNSNESEKLNLNESMDISRDLQLNLIKTPVPAHLEIQGQGTPIYSLRLSSGEEADKVLNDIEKTPVKDLSASQDVTKEEEEDILSETLQTNSEKNILENMSIDVTFAKEIVTDMTLTKYSEDSENSFHNEQNFDKAVSNVSLESFKGEENEVDAIVESPNFNEEQEVNSSFKQGEEISMNFDKTTKQMSDTKETSKQVEPIVYEMNSSKEVTSGNLLNEEKLAGNVGIAHSDLETFENFNKNQEVITCEMEQDCSKDFFSESIEHFKNKTCESSNILKNNLDNKTEVTEDNSIQFKSKNKSDSAIQEMSGKKETSCTFKLNEELCANEKVEIEQSILGQNKTGSIECFEKAAVDSEEMSVQEKTSLNNIIVEESEKAKKLESENFTFTNNSFETNISKQQTDSKVRNLSYAVVTENFKKKAVDSEGMNLSSVTSNKILEEEIIKSNVVEHHINVTNITIEDEVNVTTNVALENELMDIDEKQEQEKTEEVFNLHVEESLQEASLIEPTLVDKKVVENVEEQSKESGCNWSLDEVKYPRQKIKGFLSFKFTLLMSEMNVTIYLKKSEEDTLMSCSLICGCETSSLVEKEFKTKEYYQVFEFGCEKLKKKFEEEQRSLNTIRQVPYFLDLMNMYTSNINSYLWQIFSILRKYPGSTLQGPVLSFRLFSFPILFSVTVSINLQDLTTLSRSSLTFETDFGYFDNTKIVELFEKSLHNEKALCDFVISSNSYIIGLEQKTGYVSRRHHIRLLPENIKI